MSKKNVIRLTESQLREMISESVKNIISELDWKTYRNAAEKNKEREGEYEEMWWKIQQQIDNAVKRDDWETVEKLKRKQNAYTNKQIRGSNFLSASDIAFDDKFLKNTIDRLNNSDEDYTTFAMKRHDDGSDFTPEPRVDSYGNIHHGTYFEPHGKVGGKYYDDVITYGKWDKKRRDSYEVGSEYNGQDSEAVSDDFLKSKGFPDNEINDIEKARREIRRYRNGDYKYTKDKGWHL